MPFPLFSSSNTQDSRSRQSVISSRLIKATTFVVGLALLDSVLASENGPEQIITLMKDSANAFIQCGIHWVNFVGQYPADHNLGVIETPEQICAITDNGAHSGAGASGVTWVPGYNSGP